MRFRKAAIMAAVLGVALCAPPSSAWHVVAPIVAPVVAPHGSGGAAGAGASAGAGAAIVGGFIGAVAVLIVAHEITRKRCNLKHSTYVDTRNDVYPKYTPWRDPCRTKKRPRPIAVRG